MKKRLAVIVGGRSSEHEVSLVSGASVIEGIDTEKYDVNIIVISKEGEWLLASDAEALKSGAWKESKVKAVISPDAKDKALLVFNENGSVEKLAIDVVFPVLHGLYGEDGTIQGLFELAGIPYVGCGVIASAVGMDKWYTKQVVDTTGIRQARFVPVYRDELKEMDKVIDKIEKAYPYPYFVKPSNAGSSKGVSKAADREGLKKALLLAAEHDRKILVEETIVGRELECAVLGGFDVKASGVGEILAAAEFYDFDAKYNNAESKTVLSPELPEGKTGEIREAAVKIFKALDGYGLSRVDFFLENATNEIVFNEINTLPGFTAISMYPMLWKEQGIDKKALVMVSLSSYQKTESGVEEIKTSAPGIYSLINGRHFVKYEEKTEDGKKNKVLLKFVDNSFEMNKSGEVTSTLNFEEGVKTEGLYKTPFGTFVIDTDTKRLVINVTESNIVISLEYELSIDGEYVADCSVEIEIK